MRATSAWLCVLLVSCAGGDPANSGVSFGPGLGGSNETSDEPWWTDGPPPTDDTTGNPFGTTSEGEGDEDPGLPPDLGACDGPEDCLLNNTTCYLPQGICVGGMCDFEFKASGTPCDDADPCTEVDACDGFGLCSGTPKQCLGGECVLGECTGAECDPGTADCNDNPMDGCETTLGTDDDCNACGDSCDAGPNASGSCNAGTCAYDCDSGFGNCDDDWANGCEIPLGANQCDAGGLNPNGCWTSHCGSSTDADAVNFGTWFCFDCTTCNEPVAGQCQWCNHDTGNWFPLDSCFCGNNEGLACGP